MSRPRKLVDGLSEAEIFQTGFTRVPVFWIDHLFALDTGIPPMFWKFLLAVWREVCDPNRGFQCVKTMMQFPGTGRTVAIKWTAALWASCLFDIEYGKRHISNLPGTPTVIRYRMHSSVREWTCFIEALRDVLHRAKEDHNDVDDTEPFKIELTFCVARKRRDAGLPIDECLKRIEEWVKDGKITVKQDGEYTLTMRRRTDRTGVLDAEGQAYLNAAN